MSKLFLVTGCWLMLILSAPALVLAQQVATLPGAEWLGRYPNKAYYQGLELFRDGDLPTATEAFQSALAGCLRDTHGLWIDAIPVHAMLGECFYQAGDLRQAVVQIEAALSLLSRNRSWIERFDWTVAAAGNAQPADERSTWIADNRMSILATPERLMIAAGDPKVARSAGGRAVLALAGRAQLDAIEIYRGAALASYRRRLILGEIADQTSRVTPQPRAVAAADQPQATLPRTLPGAVDRCLELACGQPQTVEDFESLAVLEQAIHPLTPVLLLAAARLASEQNQFAQSAALASGAAEAAGLLGQPELVAEAMLVAVGCSNADTLAERPHDYAAVAVRYLRRGRMATVGALLAASEAALQSDDTNTADQLLKQAAALLQRRNLRLPRLAARGDYLAACLAARSGQSMGAPQPTAVDDAVQRVLSFARGPQTHPPSPGTPRLFQMNLALARSRHRGVDPQQAEKLLERVTDDPPTWLWKVDPVDALTFHADDRSPAIAAQLNLASQRPDATNLPSLADSLLRYRFLAQLPLGGRVQQVRWIASVDPERLFGPAAALRADAPENLQRLIDELTKTPAPADPNAGPDGALEALAIGIALERFMVPGAVPPPLADATQSGGLSDDAGMLIFVDLGDRFHGLLLRGERTLSWSLPPSRTLQAEVVAVMRAIGVPTVTAGARLAGSQRWQSEIAKISRRLIPAEHRDALTGLTQLTIVPDGVLWYLPMELLPLNGDAQQGSPAARLGDRVAIRYCPTPGLALVPHQRAAEPQTIMLAGHRLLGPGHAIGEAWGGPAADAAADVLAVLDVVTVTASEPLEFVPLPKAHGPLRQWLRLPLAVPRSVLLPALRTGAEETPIGDGRELFLILTALRCCDVQEVLLSRWAVGGESTRGLVSELLQDMPFTGIRPAWQRSNQLLRRRVLDPQSEPLLVDKDAQRDQVDGEHPLFWSGYLLDAPFEP